MAKTQRHKRRIRIRNLVIRIFMILVFTGVVLLVVENLVVPAMTNQHVSIEYGERVLSNVGLAFVLSEEFEVPLDIQVIQSLRQQYGESAVKLVSNGAVLSGENLPPTAKQICLTKLWVVEALPISEGVANTDTSISLVNALNQIPVESKYSLTFDDFCAARGKLKVQSSLDDKPIIGVFPFTTGESTYFYPFDTRSLNLDIWVETEVEYENGTTEALIIAPNVQQSHANFLDWQLHLFKEQIVSENRAHPVTSHQLTLERTFASRLLTTTLLLSLFIIILLLGFTHKIDAFIQASVAVLLTLLGIPSLLSPVPQTTIVDQAILGLYIMFALVVLSHLTVKPIWARTQVSEEVVEEDSLNDPAERELSSPDPDSPQE